MSNSRILMLALAATIASGCTKPEAPLAAKLELPRTATACLAARGNWGPQGLFQIVGCSMKTADGGKTCTDSDQCQGTCLAPDRAISGTHVIGRCSDHEPLFGTFNYVEHGVAVNIAVE
jgi:hypothetical protein